jgi:anaerobic ribonucleoside-triphosphate reductase activating protein
MTPVEPRLRVHAFQPASRSNGPGWRAVLWLQGCTLGCPGCFNPETHTTQAGDWRPVNELCLEILNLQPSIEGLTISGGEPLQQLPALLTLLGELRRRSALSVVLFSGYTWDEIQRMPRRPQLTRLVDVLIAGRYDPSQRVAHGLVGSSNKTIHFFSDRYNQTDLENVPEAEVILSQNGEIIFSGINPVRWTD